MYVFNSPCTYGVLAHVFVQLCRYLAVYDSEDRQKLLEAYDDEVSSLFIVAGSCVRVYCNRSQIFWRGVYCNRSQMFFPRYGVFCDLLERSSKHDATSKTT